MEKLREHIDMFLYLKDPASHKKPVCLDRMSKEKQEQVLGSRKDILMMERISIFTLLWVINNDSRFKTLEEIIRDV
jgi:hypothetical protein